MVKKSSNNSLKSKISSLTINYKRVVVLAAVVSAGAIGVMAFAQTPKTSYKSQPKGSLSLSYVNEKPLTANIDSKGNINYIKRSRAVEIATDGKVFCTPEDGNNVTTRKLSSTELQNIRSKVKAQKVEDQASETTDTPGVAVNSFRVINISNNNSIKRRAVYRPQLESPAFKAAVAAIEELCNNASEPVPAVNVPEFTPSSTVTKAPSLLEKVSQAITPKVSAQAPADPATPAPPPPPSIFELASESDQQTRVNFQRTSRGIAAMHRSPCMDDIARDWALYMSNTNTLAHSSFGNLLSNHCGQWYGMAGENVGYGGTSTQVFDAFMASPGHAANILNTNYSLFGLGAYRNPTTNRLWISQVFLRCEGDCSRYVKNSY